MASPAGSPMRRLVHRSGVRWFLKLVRGTSAVVGTLVAAVLKATPEGAASLWGPLQSVVEFGHETAWLWLAGALVFGGAASWFLGKLDHPAVLDAVDAILAEFREALFGNLGGDTAHHRVTLFKRVPWKLAVARDNAGKLRWPWSGWLVPVARSGHGTRNTNVRFLCPDDTDNAQGVAGRAWASSRAVIVQELLDLGKTEVVSEDEIRSYAEQMFVPDVWVKKRSPRARSLMGFRVEDARSNPWGVLVVDSRMPKLNTQLAQEEFNAYAPVLARLVQGA